MSFISDFFATAKLVLTLEDRVTAVAGRLDKLETREAELRERLVRVESILEVALYGGRRRLDRD